MVTMKMRTFHLYSPGYLMGSILESFRKSFHLTTSLHMILFPHLLVPGQTISMSASIFMTVSSTQISAGTSVTRWVDLLDFGQVLKPLATINLPKSPLFLGNFCKGVKSYHFSTEIIFGQLL